MAKNKTQEIALYRSFDAANAYVIYVDTIKVFAVGQCEVIDIGETRNYVPDTASPPPSCRRKLVTIGGIS